MTPHGGTKVHTHHVVYHVIHHVDYRVIHHVVHLAFTCFLEMTTIHVQVIRHVDYHVVYHVPTGVIRMVVQTAWWFTM